MYYATIRVDAMLTTTIYASTAYELRTGIATAISDYTRLYPGHDVSVIERGRV